MARSNIPFGSRNSLESHVIYAISLFSLALDMGLMKIRGVAKDGTDKLPETATNIGGVLLGCGLLPMHVQAKNQSTPLPPSSRNETKSNRPFTS